MNKNELGFISRGMKPDRVPFRKIHGCYVNVNREIISTFTEFAGTMTDETYQQYCKVLRKTAQGKPDQTLFETSFSGYQAKESEKHKRLRWLLDTELEDEEVLKAFYQAIADSVSLESNYLIIAAHSQLDVPFEKNRGDVFSSITVAICPVEQAKASMDYNHDEKKFSVESGDYAVKQPHFGFIFPAFEGGGANIYKSVFYRKDKKADCKELVDAIFGNEPDIAPEKFKKQFNAMLSNILLGCADTDGADVMLRICEEMRDVIALNKESHALMEPAVNEDYITDVMAEMGCSEKIIEQFKREYKNAFGESASFNPKILAGNGKTEFKAAGLKAQIEGELLETVRVERHYGRTYMMLPVDSSLVVNGVFVMSGVSGVDDE